jgi:D-alanyl-lipoteichoic acid acyltransferase DltB (MBOAT superfamily)
LIWETLSLAAKGHTWVGVIRLFGFNVFRNTYKPLLAESIVEFWNRYYYYFKELLVEFFFFPTYLRYFRKRAVLRIITAVFAAAFVGNMYYHLLQAKSALIAADGEALWRQLGPRLVYCFTLSVGIAISMLRQQRRRGSEGLAISMGGFSRLRRIGGVLTFFAIINLWNVHSSASIVDRWQLLLAMLGL